jgi:hypothetical protein
MGVSVGSGAMVMVGVAVEIREAEFVGADIHPPIPTVSTRTSKHLEKILVMVGSVFDSF